MKYTYKIIKTETIGIDKTYHNIWYKVAGDNKEYFCVFKRPDSFRNEKFTDSDITAMIKQAVIDNHRSKINTTSDVISSLVGKEFTEE